MEYVPLFAMEVSEGGGSGRNGRFVRIMSSCRRISSRERAFPLSLSSSSVPTIVVDRVIYSLSAVGVRAVVGGSGQGGGGGCFLGGV